MHLVQLLLQPHERTSSSTDDPAFPTEMIDGMIRVRLIPLLSGLLTCDEENEAFADRLIEEVLIDPASAPVTLWPGTGPDPSVVAVEHTVDEHAAIAVMIQLLPRLIGYWDAHSSPTVFRHLWALFSGWYTRADDDLEVQTQQLLLRVMVQLVEWRASGQPVSDRALPDGLCCELLALADNGDLAQPVQLRGAAIQLLGEEALLRTISPEKLEAVVNGLQCVWNHWPAEGFTLSLQVMPYPLLLLCYHLLPWLRLCHCCCLFLLLLLYCFVAACCGALSW